MTQTASEKANISIVRKFFEVGPSKGDLAAADVLLHPGFSLHTPLPTPGPGIEAVNEHVSGASGEGQVSSARVVLSGWVTVQM